MGGGDQKQDKRSLDMMLWLVWVSLLFSLFIYLVVIAVIPPPPDFRPPEIARGTPPKILIILAMATATLIPILFNTRNKMFFDPLGDKFRPGSDGARSAYFTMSLTTWIMCELIGVFGFVVHFLTYEVLFALPFVVLGGVLMAWFRPKPQVAEDAKGDEGSPRQSNRP